MVVAEAENEFFPSFTSEEMTLAATVPNTHLHPFLATS